LQVMLNFQRSYVTSTVAAQVIGGSGTDQSRVLYIDKGSNDGLKADQAVMTPDGVVGKIREVFPHTAQVLLLNDPTSGAGVLLASTRIRAILKGSQGGHTVITNLTSDSRIKPGEKVLTSGGDQVYPRGLNVGVIESIAPDPEHQPYTLIQVKPATNLFQLEEVLVITGGQGDLPLLAQQDLASGLKTAKEIAEAKAKAKAEADAAAAEAAARSAAEIVSDKLPSLQEKDAANGINPADGTVKPTAQNPAGVVPRPVPALHPDRYTPGTTPPASSLTPGAQHPVTTYPAQPAPAPRVVAPRPAEGDATTTPEGETPAPKPVRPPVPRSERPATSTPPTSTTPPSAQEKRPAQEKPAAPENENPNN
ncbi:MAG TPA: rod shape-determining protein MreC, partial [Edaphobacter sp.]